METLRIILGSIFVLFIPGFALSWLFFPKKTEIDWIERIALAFGLSIATVPLAVFYLNYVFGVKINIQNVTVTIITIIVIAYLGYQERTRKTLSKYIKEKIQPKLRPRKDTKNR
jgi:uncharacterized membrane protein